MSVLPSTLHVSKIIPSKVYTRFPNLKINIPEILVVVFWAHQYHYYLCIFGIKIKGKCHNSSQHFSEEHR